MAPPEPEIPKSDSTVKVSIIDTGARIYNIGNNVFLEPTIDGFTHMNCPAFSFLIEHQDTSGKTSKYLFDLSMRKDLENLVPRNMMLPKMFGWEVQVSKDVRDKLEEQGIQPGDIDGIIWSHWHWDHTGDPTRFPSSTMLIVGPGFKKNFIPAYPTNPDSDVAEEAWSERELREIEFDHGLSIEGFQAYDFFGDGSFYLLDSYGHTIGHMCGLARTTPSTFILMGGDACHYPGVFRPSAHRHLPENITPHPLTGALDIPCPGAMFAELHPNHTTTEPFHTYPDVPDGQGVNHSREAALTARDKLMKLDASDDVLTVVAHDQTILDVIESFPASANDWKAKNWGDKARWRFLRDYKVEK